MATKNTIATALKTWAANTGRAIPTDLPELWLEIFKEVPDSQFIAAQKRLLHGTQERSFPTVGQIWALLRTLPQDAASSDDQPLNPAEAQKLVKKYLPQLIQLAEMAKAKREQQDWKRIKTDPEFAARDAEIRRIIAEAEAKAAMKKTKTSSQGSLDNSEEMF